MLPGVQMWFPVYLCDVKALNETLFTQLCFQEYELIVYN